MEFKGVKGFIEAKDVVIDVFEVGGVFATYEEHDRRRTEACLLKPLLPEHLLPKCEVGERWFRNASAVEYEIMSRGGGVGHTIKPERLLGMNLEGFGGRD